MEMELIGSCDTQVQYAFLSAIGEPLIGKPEGPFAFYNEESKNFMVIGGEDVELISVSLARNMADLPMAAALLHKASFSVKDDVVTCSLKGVEATGASYPEAAMKAFVAFKAARPG